MNQLEYLPGIAGQSVQLDGPSAFVGIAEEMRSREWDYDLGFRDLVTATRPARTVDVTFHADYETADELRRVADADVMARTPGTFVAQNEWKQRGYILASDVNDIHYGRLSTGLKIALLDGAWWRLVKRSFVPEITTPEYRSATGETVTASGASGAPLHALTVDGKSVQDGTPTPNSPVPVEVVALNFNQKFPTKTISYSDSGYTITSSNDGAIEINVTTAGATQGGGINATAVTANIPSGHKYVLLGGTSNVDWGIKAASKYYSHRVVFTASSNIGYSNVAITFTDLPVGNYVIHPMIVDLTEMFGAGNEPATVEEFEAMYPEAYYPYDTGSTQILLKTDTSYTPIDLQGNVLASLPDGTKDELTVDSVGHREIEKHTGYIASYNGESVGDNYISTTGELSTGASVYYELATPQTIDLGYIDMPAIPLDAQISITAAVTPTITAEWQISRDAYLDYPHDYEYDYQKTSYTGGITPSVLTPSEPYLVVYGPAVNPYVIVGGNRYQVNVTVPSGGYLVVDGRDKTIQLTLADGTVQNVFSSGVRGGGAGGGSYIFERVPAGTSEVTYDGSFGFDLGWYEEEGEPPWSQS